jgi:PAT family beta-lactamase induction signal transducer AmpG
MSPPTASIGGEGAIGAAAEAAPAYKNPFLWVPTSYLTMGLVYATVAAAASIMFKNLGMDNARATFWSSALGFPYILKFLWAPILELYKTKKFFVLMMQFLLSGVFAAIGFSLKLPGTAWVAPVLGFVSVAAFFGATQDIGTDGVYVTTLDPSGQAKYTGVQSMCWNLGPILANGVLLTATGVLYDKTGSYPTAWMTFMLIAGALVFAMALYHMKMLPPGAKAKDSPKTVGDAMATFGKAFVTFFQKKDIWRMIAFAFGYRLAYGLLEKLTPLFMVDARANGGLGLSNQTLGQINGIFGTGAFILGSAIGGLWVARSSLKKTLLFLCLCLNIPNVTFLILSTLQPSSVYVIGAIVVVEKLGWGIGCVGQMIYMMQQMAPGPYKTAHYAFATGLMGGCMILMGMISGSIQAAVGYHTFFIIALAVAIPSILVTLAAPFHHPDVSKQPAKA